MIEERFFPEDDARQSEGPAPARFEGLTLRLLYVLVFGSMGTWMPFLNVYLQQAGLSGVEIGALSGLRPVATVVGQPVWGLVADLWGRRRTMLLTILLAALTLLGFAWRKDFGFLFLWTLVYALLSNPVGTLLDSLTLDHLDTRPWLSYGRFRLWGAVGWAVVSYAMGHVLGGQDMRLMFAWGAGLMALGWPLLLCVSRGAGQARRAPGSTWRDLRPLLQKRRLLVFLLLAALVPLGTSSLFAFLAIYMDQLGASESLIGLAFGVQGLSELPLFLVAAAIVRRWGPTRAIVIALLVFAARAFFYTLVSDPMWVVAAQLTHGSFSLLLVACVEYVNRLVPGAWRATGQSLFWAAYMGLGSGAGGLLSGFLYDYLGIRALFFVSGCIILGVAGVALAALREGRAKVGEQVVA